MKICGPFSKVKFEKVNLNSSKQLKEFLYTLGWKPDTWNFKKKEDGSVEKTSPKITLSSLESIDSTELGKLILRRAILSHRYRFLFNDDDDTSGVLGHLREDGRVEADAITLGTPTARYTHLAPVCNTPKATKKVVYGYEMREVFCCKPPYLMVGSDLKGIEARLLGHYTIPYDNGVMAYDLLNGDIHTETKLILGCDRDTAKTFRYAFMYGAGIKKLASILKCSVAEAEIKYNEFMQKSIGLSTLINALQSAYNKKGYIKGLDGRRLFIRGKHKLLNTLIQSSAAIIFKDWSCRVWSEIDRLGLDAAIIIMYHDEFQLRVHEKDINSIKKVLAMTLFDTEQHFEIRVPLLTDTKVASNWAETH